MYGERNMETYITPCKIDSQGEFAVCLRKPNRVPDQPIGAGWGGRWEAVQKGGGTGIPMADSC